MLVARQPLQTLSMSAMQIGSRRLSARLQEKDDSNGKVSTTQNGHGLSKDASKEQTPGSRSSKKRKNDYNEEDDGFVFSRVGKNKKRRKSQLDEAPKTTPAALTTSIETIEEDFHVAPVPQRATRAIAAVAAPAKDDLGAVEKAAKRRKKMSFSTPKAREQQPVRRSKRLSSEVDQQNGSPPPGAEPKIAKSRKTKESEGKEQLASTSAVQVELEKLGSAPISQENDKSENLEHEHSSTKIALPFADTPVIRRNKAMREGKSMKGDRRSSLGFRGRRASSLIETGNSNALPHQEVNVEEFYKHIESDVMEPRRMRQLLTWCATRAMHAKPKGTDFEDASAKSAVRVIEEELLKELSNRSELSDWFSRQDLPEPAKPLPEKPNPKNIQNVQKTEELEEQIARLKVEKEALQQLLEPPDLWEVNTTDQQYTEPTEIYQSLLSESDTALLDAIQASSQLALDVPRRINNISSSLGPSIDRFADGVHKIAQYKTTTDNVAGKVLSICAERLASRERAGRRKALHTEEDRSPGRDLGNVLRGLSKADR